MEQMPIIPDESRTTRRRFLKSALNFGIICAMGGISSACEKKEGMVKVPGYDELIDEFKRLHLENTTIYKELLPNLYGSQAFLNYRMSNSDISFTIAKNRFIEIKTRDLNKNKQNYIDRAKREVLLQKAEELAKQYDEIDDISTGMSIKAKKGVICKINGVPIINNEPTSNKNNISPNKAQKPIESANVDTANY
jgi:hypothetical protein